MATPLPLTCLISNGVLARVFVPDLDAAIPLYQELAQVTVVNRFSFRDVELAQIGPFLVLLDASDLTPVPRDQGFSSQREKDAFFSGHFRLAVTLPAQPLAGMVRWADGAALRLPLLTARAAFAELAAQRPCGGPDACAQLTVTGARPGVVTVDTSRGLARVPAWHFTVAGLGWQVSEVAVARSALADLPGYGPIPPAGRNTPGVSGLTAVSADGRTLTLSFIGSACDAGWGAY